jgi:uncharacterized protein (TIGR01777 family)
VRVIVSGGTGFIGRALGHALLPRGDEVVVLTRGEAGDLSHRCRRCGVGGKLEFVSWTPEEEGTWMKVVEGADAVIHLAGASVTDERWTEERKALLRSSRIASTALLARAMAQAKRRPSVFISASGIGHYGIKTGDEIVTEASPPGDDFLAQLTCDWEAATAPARDAGVRICLPRMGLVLGRNGGLFGKLAPIFRAFVGGPLGDGNQYMPWVHVRDTVRALEAMLDRKDLEGVYNVVAPEPVTMNAFADAMAESLHRPCVMRVPALAVKMIMGAEAAEAVLTGQRALPKRLLDEGFPFVFPDLRSALADLSSSVVVQD